MTSHQKGLWVVIGLIFLLILYKLYLLYFYSPNLPGITQNPKFIYDQSYPKDSITQCKIVKVNIADSLIFQSNLAIPPKIISNILKYRNKIKFFLNNEDFQNIYGIDKIYPQIQHCLDFSLPNTNKINLNTADSTQFALFLPSYLAARIHKYRLKKQAFTSWNELNTIYGLENKHLLLLKHFTYLDTTLSVNSHNSHISKPPKIIKFNLNTADSLQLEKLPKIGPKMASRIIKFRNLLPYFIDYSQLNDIYGMNDTILSVLKEYTFLEKMSNYKPKNLNLLDYSELAKHPYIGKQNAKLIVNYRNMHGNFQKWHDLDNIKELQLKQKTFLYEYFVIE